MSTLPPTHAALVAQGIAALKAGDRARALALLTEATERHPTDEHAWLWRSGAESTDSARRHCLERVLALNPHNSAARQGLDYLPPAMPELPSLLDRAAVPDQPAPAPQPAVPQIEVTPAVEPPPVPPNIPPPIVIVPPAPRKRWPLWAYTLVIMGALSSLFVCACLVIGVLSTLGQRVEATTIAPAATPRPGWKRFSGGGATIYLPPAYVGGDVSSSRTAVIKQIEALGPEYDHAITAIEDTPGIAIWALDPQASDLGMFPTVAVTKESVSSRISLDTYVDAALKHLPSELHVVKRESLTLGDQPARRVLLEQGSGVFKVQLVAYFVQGGPACWTVLFTTSADEYPRQRTLFEQSVRTFAVAP